MDQKFTIDLRQVRRITCAILAALLLAAGLPLFQTSRVAADQFSRRSIQLSDAAPSGSTVTSGIGSGTNVTYQITLSNAHTAGSIVIDFCTQDPIIDDACAAPTGMSAPSAVSLQPLLLEQSVVQAGRWILQLPVKLSSRTTVWLLTTHKLVLAKCSM